MNLGRDGSKWWWAEAMETAEAMEANGKAGVEDGAR
jgi:hypothetical protein